MSEKKNNIELVMIIDRSGSMAGMESDTIGAERWRIIDFYPKWAGLE